MRAFKVKNRGRRMHFEMPHEVFEKMGLAALMKHFALTMETYFLQKGKSIGRL
jgi:hypothetical protein